MIDIHSHILPQLDDGAKSLEEALEMARIAAERWNPADGVHAAHVQRSIRQPGTRGGSRQSGRASGSDRQGRAARSAGQRGSFFAPDSREGPHGRGDESEPAELHACGVPGNERSGRRQASCFRNCCRTACVRFSCIPNATLRFKRAVPWWRILFSRACTCRLPR